MIGKKKYFKSIIGILLTGILIFLLNNIIPNKPEEVSFEGKTNGYNNLYELEAASPIIVQGVKIKEKSTKVHKSELSKLVNGGYTESVFRISKVYKNIDNEAKIKPNKDISISEVAYYDKETNTHYTINDYKNMNEGEEYLLFLIPVDDGMFSTRGVTFGKISLSESLKLSGEKHENIVKEAREKYKNK